MSMPMPTMVPLGLPKFSAVGESLHNDSSIDLPVAPVNPQPNRRMAGRAPEHAAVKHSTHKRGNGPSHSPSQRQRETAAIRLSR
jgi:hypothetical protein